MLKPHLYRTGLEGADGSRRRIQMKKTTPNNSLLTAKDVAQMAKVSPKTVNRWRRDGLLRGIKIGTVVRFDAKDVDEFIRRHRD